MNKSPEAPIGPRLVWRGKEESERLARTATEFQIGLASVIGNPAAEMDSSCSFSSKGHRILIGDNLDWLKILKAEGQEFDFIYTDPPYNTGQPLSFLDKHRSTEHGSDGDSAWLSMILPRFLCTRDVMSKNGILFVSIDDREVATLRLVLDEVFGRSNFVGTLKWKKKRKPSFLDKHLGNTIEYVLAYAKDASSFPRLLGETAEEMTRPVLNASNGECQRLLPAGFPAKCPDGHYRSGKYVNRTLGVEFLDDVVVAQGHLVNCVRVVGKFRVSQETLSSRGYLTENLGMRRQVDPSELVRRHASDLCIDWPTNEDAETELRKLFGERVFDYPKPVGLLLRLLDMCAHDTGNGLRCLDIFAGSGTLGAAIFQGNQECNQHHTFCMIQNEEPLRNANGPWKNISDLLIERIKRTAEALEARAAVSVYTLSRRDA